MSGKIFLPLILLLLISESLRADEYQLFKINNFNGVIGLNTQYQLQETIFRNNKSEKLNVQTVTGLIGLNIKSTVWHPNFLQIEFNGNYNPGTRRDIFLIAPDRSELSSLESISGKTIFFSQRPLRLIFYGNYTHNFINRELTTNVETFKNNKGTNIAIRNRFMPINFQWNKEELNQYELETKRTFKSRVENIFAKINKSFSKYDITQLKYSMRNASYQYTNNAKFQNKLQELNFNGNIYFDKYRESSFMSNIWLAKQTGSQPFDRLNIVESLNLKLPLNFKLGGDYRYIENRYEYIKNNLQNINARLQHRLYKSLFSSIFFKTDKIKNTNYDEKRNNFGFSVRYTKKIPGGILNLNYVGQRRKTERTNQTLLLKIFEEEHELKDGQIVLLEYPFVIEETIVVKDETGVIIYQKDVDYLVIERDSFIEIQRLPGGRIPNGATILVDYSAQQPIDYNYTLRGKNYSASLNLFNNFLHLYYRRNKNDFSNTDPLLLRILKWTDQQVVGAEVSIKRFKTGIENDDFKTNIVPYKARRYFTSISGKWGHDLSFILTANYRDYKLIQENEKQTFADGTTRIIYQFLRRTRMELTASYRKQIGRGLNLELWNGHFEWQTQLRSTWFKLGLEFYRRNFEGEKINYSNAYFRIERKF